MQVKVENGVNAATISWSVGDSNEFSPRDLAGTYTCEARNEFRTVTERLFLPSDIMEKHGKFLSYQSPKRLAALYEYRHKIY